MLVVAGAVWAQWCAAVRAPCLRAGFATAQCRHWSTACTLARRPLSSIAGTNNANEYEMAMNAPPTRNERTRSRNSYDASAFQYKKPTSSPEYANLSKPRTTTITLGVKEGASIADTLLQHEKWVTPSHLTEWVKDGRVTVFPELTGSSDEADGGTVIRDMTELSKVQTAKAHVRINCPGRSNQTDAGAIPLDIVYQDSHILCLNKQPHIYTQPTGRDRTNNLLSALHARFRSEDQYEDIVPRGVHRLDEQTTGVVVVALGKTAASRLGKMFEGKQVEKTYLALVEGNLLDDEGVIKVKLSPHTCPQTNRSKQIVREDQGGKVSESTWKVLARGDIKDPVTGSVRAHASLVEVRPRTGRTHQIRAHMAHLGAPLLADDLYGATTCTAGWLERIPLHCSEMCFLHPATGEPFSAHAPLHEDMVKACKHLGIPLPPSSAPSSK